VPANYEQLVAVYGDLMRRLVRRQLGGRARPEDVEDVYQYILMMIMPDEHATPPRPGIIAQFDPGKASPSAKDPFGALLCRKVVLYCQGKREELARVREREPQWLSGEERGGEAWVDRLTGVPDEYDVLAGDDVMERVRDHLAGVPRLPGARPLLPLLDHLAATVAAGRAVGPEGVRREFGLNRAAAGDYLGDLRTALGSLRLGADRVTFPLGGLELTPAELLAHIDALRGNPGHHVVATWRRAGLRLKDAGKDWYLPLAKEEMRLHPESKQAGGANVQGGRGSPVKYALIRALERMLTSVATFPVPPPPAVTAEAALRSVPGMTEERLAAALAALEET